MAANGQRIHPAGSRRISSGPHPHAAVPAEQALDPSREHDACGVGFVATASGARSHEVVAMALEAVARVAHRGAASTDNSGDGAGLLTQIPARLFYRDAYRLGLHLQPGLPFGVGAFFLPREPEALGASVRMIEEVLADDGIPFLGWRDVPINPGALGPTALASCPVIRQVLVGRPALAADEDAWERALYLARREMERRAEARNLPGFYACSLSCRTIVYKALLTGTQLPAFFTDFRYPEYESAIAVFHQRYSTNTLPSWPLAQPFRLLAHNGEINTLWGNRNAMTMRQPMLVVAGLGREDRAAARGHLGGGQRLGQPRQRHGAAGALGPRSGAHRDDDGAAGLGEVPRPRSRGEGVLRVPPVRAGAVGRPGGDRLHRRRARRARRWTGTASAPAATRCGATGWWSAGSEVGLVDLDPREVVECGKVGPGEVLVVDTARGEVIRNLDAKREVAGRRPYARWVARYMATLVPDPARVPPVARGRRAGAPRSAAFGYGVRGSAPRARADGRHRRRSGLEHGRRHADPAALGGAAEPLRLLPPALRPGDQPADRFAARGDGDVAPDAPGPPRLAAARAALLRPDAPAGAPDPAGRGDGRAPERGRLLHRHPRRRVGRDARASTGSVPRSPRSAARPSGRRGGAPASSSSATGPPTSDTRRSRCCSRSARCGSTWCTPGSGPGSGSWPRPATRSTSTTSRR